jgi:hypothetical protein
MRGKVIRMGLTGAFFLYKPEGKIEALNPRRLL